MEGLIATYSLVAMAAVFKAYMDREAHERPGTWKNKYKQPLAPGKPKWYYLGLYKPVYEEAWPFSSTLGVLFTDRWHLYMTFCFLSLIKAVSVSDRLGILHFIGLSVLFFTLFSLVYHLLRGRIH